MGHQFVPLIFALSSAIGACAQVIAQSTPVRDATDTPVQAIRAGRMRITDALTLAFSAAGIPGGLQLTRCGRREASVDVPDHPSLKAILERINTTSSPSTLTFSKNGVLNLSMPGPVTALLDTHISGADIEMPERNVASAVAALLALPEVKLALQSLGLTESIAELGFSHLRKPGAAPKIEHIPLEDVTLRDALNEVARRLGNGFWVYEEDTCAETRTFTISFRVR